MNLLLDTHTFLWWDRDRSKISARALTELSNSQNQLYLSLASVWEIQIKHQLGKLELGASLEKLIADQEQVNRLLLLPIKVGHISHLYQLPLRHRDPFDRLLIAQAFTENFTVVSADSVFGEYGVPLIW